MRRVQPDLTPEELAAALRAEGMPQWAEEIKRRTERAISLDTPQDQDWWDIGLEVGAGFLPGIGTSLGVRDIERARRDEDPLGISLSLLGMVPVVGGLGTLASRGKRAAERALSRPRTQALTPQEEAAARRNLPPELRDFGAKEQREEAIRRRVLRQAEQAARQAEEAAQRQPTRATRPGAQQSALPATYYRDLARSQGDEAVLDEARRGAHIRRKPDGSYVGAPRHVRSPQALRAMRRDLDQQFEEGLGVIQYADPARAGTWYDRYKEALALSSEPYQIGPVRDAHAVYSAGVSPQSETMSALYHGNTRALGDPQRAKYQQQSDALDQAAAAGEPARMGPKTGEYRNKIDPETAIRGLFGTNDFRWAQAFRNTHPDGRPWESGVGPTMHTFMDGETALAVDRANQAAVGGRTDWTGAHLQEVPWVVGKAQDFYNRGYQGGQYTPGLDQNMEPGMVQAIRDANNTAMDYFPDHMFGATYEQVPGLNTGHVPQILDMDFDARQQYGNVGSWAVTNTDAADMGMNPLIGSGSRDVIHRALGLRQLPTVQGVGQWRNSAGQIENNPVNVTRTLGHFTKGDTSQLDPDFVSAMDAAETFRGAMDVQEAAAGNIMHAGKGADGFLVELGDAANPRQATAEEMAALSRALAGTDFDVSASPRGVAVAPFAGGNNLPQQFEQLNAPNSALRSAMPAGGRLRPAGFQTTFNPISYGQGQATTQVLENFANLPPQIQREVTQRLAESEEVRQRVKLKRGRDDFLGTGRDDVQLMRRFFSEADWARAVELMRQGMTPAAAVAALGYSLSAMADAEMSETQPQQPPQR